MVNKNLSKMWTNKHFKTPNLSRRHFILLVWLLLWEEHESLIVVRQGGTGDQGQAMLLCLVSEDGDLSSSGSSISDEDRSRRRTNQRLIITIQMNVHSCIAAYSARAPWLQLHAAVLRRCCTVLAKFSAVTWRAIFARGRHVSAGARVTWRCWSGDML